MSDNYYRQLDHNHGPPRTAYERTLRSALLCVIFRILNDRGDQQQYIRTASIYISEFAGALQHVVTAIVNDEVSNDLLN